MVACAHDFGLFPDWAPTDVPATSKRKSETSSSGAFVRFLFLSLPVVPPCVCHLSCCLSNNLIRGRGLSGLPRIC